MKLLALVALFAAYCAACGGAQHGSAIRTGATPCTNEATAAAVQTALSSAIATPTRLLPLEPDDETHCRLHRALIVSADLAGEWQEQFTLPAGGGEPERFNCALGASDLAAEESTLQESAPAGAHKAALVEEVIAVSDGPAFMASLRHSCAALASRSPEDAELYAPISLPSAGDELAAYADTSFGRADDRGTVYVREGNLISMVSLLGGGATKLIDVSRIAARKLQSVGPLPEPTRAPGSGCPPTAAPGTSDDPTLALGLVPIDDMPFGWAIYHPQPCGLLASGGTCVADRQLPEPVRSAAISYESLHGYLAQSVDQYSDDAARSFLDEVDRRLDRASECMRQLAESHTIHVSWARVPAPKLGDQCIAWRTSLSENNINRSVLVYAIRRGRFIVEATFSQPERQTAPDDFEALQALAEFNGFAQLADTRLAKLQTTVDTR